MARLVAVGVAPGCSLQFVDEGHLESKPRPGSDPMFQRALDTGV